MNRSLRLSATPLPSLAGEIAADRNFGEIYQEIMVESGALAVLSRCVIYTITQVYDNFRNVSRHFL